ncbi:MAG: class I SAM-dependent methyltransferase, partial [Pseudohongiella sp.]
RFFVKLDSTDIAIRCLSCQASLVTLSLVNVLRSAVDISESSVYELSARGPLVSYLKKACKDLTCSEFFDDIAPGSYRNGVVCQDVQQLTFKDQTFDVCTSLEVFEHVPADDKGFAEVYRVLKDKGIFVFTVPLDLSADTLERATLGVDGKIEHMTSPEYHIDPLRNNAPILAFRTYGLNIVNSLIAAGFQRAEIRQSKLFSPWGYARPVVVAYKKWAPDHELQSDPLLVHHATGSIG